MKNSLFLIPPIFKKFKIRGFFSRGIPHQTSPTLFLHRIYPKYNVFLPSQIHSANVLHLKTFIKQENFRGDGVITRISKIVIGVKTADCVPILISTKDNSLIGAIHAGWRGSVNKILHNALVQILNLGYKPDDILIAIGPHIGPCCYEVGNDVIQILKANFQNYEDFLQLHNGKFHLHLAKLNLHQAFEFGIPEENVWLSDECTFCQNDKYYSYRYHGLNRGYQLSFILKD